MWIASSFLILSDVYLSPSRVIRCGSSERSLFVLRGAIKIEDSRGRADAINEY
jgi:hypothetical protein